MTDTFSFNAVFQNLLDFLPRFLLALGIVLLSYLLSKGAASLIRKSLTRGKHDPELIILMEMLVKWGVLGFGIVLGIEQLAPGQLNSLVAGLGIAGFTIGFALQDVAKNFIAGIIILLQQPFDLGDGIEVANFAGKVLQISLRATEIMTWDGRHVYIPNSEILASPIINLSRATRRRLEIQAGVAYESDLDKVARIALSTIREIDGVLVDPAPEIKFASLGDFAVNFSLYYWIDTEQTDLIAATDAGIRSIKRRFEEMDVEMPFPTQDIRLLRI
ncbi:MAG: mechanosensitive ion channel family protein [Anaerolineales bacterium]|nr:mechanosensitive ion channel family protein [Anaerolineales bacterium]